VHAAAERAAEKKSPHRRADGRRKAWKNAALQKKESMASKVCMIFPQEHEKTQSFG
jgi:hypothetical protein